MSPISELLNWASPDFLVELERLGYAIVPMAPTAEMIEEGMHPARPGSIGDVYREMVKAGRVKA